MVESRTTTLDFEHNGECYEGILFEDFEFIPEERDCAATERLVSYDIELFHLDEDDNRCRVDQISQELEDAAFEYADSRR